MEQVAAHSRPIAKVNVIAKLIILISRVKLGNKASYEYC